MAATSTKDISANIKTISAGKSVSANMQLDTNATIPIPTLKNIAESLVALEMDLKEAQTERGYRWHAFPFLTKSGKLGLVVTLYHPDHDLGIENVIDTMGEENLVALLDGERATIHATRKEPSGKAK